MSPLHRRILISLGSIGATLVCAEFGLRLFYSGPATDSSTQSALRPSDNPALAYELAAGVEGRFWNSDVRINADGFRDADYDHERTRGVTRIIALGDSITFGNRLAVEDTWSEQLETLLAEQGEPAEVLNLGVGGYDTRQEIEFLVQTGMPFQPDCVVVAYCINDLATVSVNLERIDSMRREPRGILRYSHVARWIDERWPRAQHVPPEAREYREDQELSALRTALVPLVPRSTTGDPARFANDLHRLGWYTEAGRLERVGLEFERLAALADEQGFVASIFVVPYLDEGPRDRNRRAWSMTYSMVRHVAERAGLRFIEMRSAFDDLRALRIAVEDMVHPNADGHQRIAEQLIQSRVDWMPN